MRPATLPNVATAAMLSAYCGGSALPQVIPPIGNTGHDVDHAGALREAAEDDLGVGA